MWRVRSRAVHGRAESTVRIILQVVLALALLPLGTALAQSDGRYALTGRVIDQESKAGLPGVNVYLSGTTLGTVTDREGFFRIDGIPIGAHTVVASMVGYERQSVERLLGGGKEGEPILFELKAIIVPLEAVNVVAERPRNWKSLVRKFETRFLGTTENGRSCEILNPEVLDLTYEQKADRLSARSTAPLVVHNRALGFRLIVDLDTLVATAKRWEWRGMVRFEEMESESEKQARRLVRRREETYRGSVGHFLSALVHRRLEEEGFRVVPVREPGNGWEGELDSKVLDHVVRRGPNAYVFYLQGPIVLWVVHGDEDVVDSRVSDFSRRGLARYGSARRGGIQGSWLGITRLEVPVDLAGWMFAREGLVRYGDWAERRFGDELPRDYRPGSGE